MRRITLEEIRDRIYVTLRTYPPHVKRKMFSKLPAEGDDATAEIAEVIAQQIAGGELRVIAPDRPSFVGFGGSTGKWSPDDPDPTDGLD